jgi:hypothetical protein
MEYLEKKKKNQSYFIEFYVDKPVGTFNSAISSSGTLSRCLINDRTELP